VRKYGVSQRCFSNTLHRFLFFLRSLCIMVVVSPLFSVHPWLLYRRLSTPKLRTTPSTQCAWHCPSLSSAATTCTRLLPCRRDAAIGCPSDRANYPPLPFRRISGAACHVGLPPSSFLCPVWVPIPSLVVFEPTRRAARAPLAHHSASIVVLFTCCIAPTLCFGPVVRHCLTYGGPSGSCLPTVVVGVPLFA